MKKLYNWENLGFKMISLSIFWRTKTKILCNLIKKVKIIRTSSIRLSFYQKIYLEL